MELAIWASGNGTNAENLIKTLSGKENIRFTVYTHRADAGVIGRAKRLGVAVDLFGLAEMRDGRLLARLQAQQTQLIILAGFLKQIPSQIIAAYPGYILNIHPALLPKFGGKGMYGHRVHQAVIKAREAQTGISIHQVTEEYDQGAVLFQAKCPVRSDDTPESLAQRIHQLEYQHFPEVVLQQVRKIKANNSSIR